jgi:hypothetical protein
VDDATGYIKTTPGANGGTPRNRLKLHYTEILMSEAGGRHSAEGGRGCGYQIWHPRLTRSRGDKCICASASVVGWVGREIRDGYDRAVGGCTPQRPYESGSVVSRLGDW